MLAPPEDDMTTPSPVAPIRSGHGIELRTHEVFASRAAMPAAAKYPDLIYKV